MAVRNQESNVNVQMIKSERVWQSHFKQLVSWYNKHGHYCIPINRRDLTSLRLWMTTQRRLREQQKLSSERIAQLQHISFIWNAHEADRLYQEELAQQQREKEQAEMKTRKQHGDTVGFFEMPKQDGSPLIHTDKAQNDDTDEGIAPQNSSVRFPRHCLTGAEKCMMIDIAESEKNTLSIKSSERNSTATSTSSVFTCGETNDIYWSKPRHISPEKEAILQSNMLPNAKLKHNKSIPEEPESASNELRMDSLSQASVNNKWLSIWEEVVQDDDTTAYEQLPDEISTQSSHADLSVLTAEIDRSLDTSTSVSSQPRQSRRIGGNRYHVITAVETDISDSIEEGEDSAGDPSRCASNQSIVDGEKWMTNYFNLLKFYKCHRHCSLPAKDEYKYLRSWLEHQRKVHSISGSPLPAHRRKLLEDVNFSVEDICPATKQSMHNTAETIDDKSGQISPLRQSTMEGEPVLKDLPSEEAPTAKERWTLHNGRLMAHYKNLLKFYRDPEHAGRTPNFCGTKNTNSEAQAVWSGHKTTSGGIKSTAGSNPFRANDNFAE
jgi:hypothetical protein